jgi:hypothetical protein
VGYSKKLANSRGSSQAPQPEKPGISVLFDRLDQKWDAEFTGTGCRDAIKITSY